jgi:hypothetical protein
MEQILNYFSPFKRHFYISILSLCLIGLFSFSEKPIAPKANDMSYVNNFFSHHRHPLINTGFKFKPPPPTLIRVDTTIRVASGVFWKATFSAPANLYSKNGSDSGHLFVNFLGQGESVSNAYGPTSMTKYGPLDYIDAGWDGGIVLGNGTHYPIFVHVSQQGAFPYNVKERIDSCIVQLLTRFRIKKPSGKPSVHLMGLSAGGYTSVVDVMQDPVTTTGPWPSASRVTSVVSVEGTRADDYPTFPTPIQNFARSGGRLLALEGSLDGGKDYTTTVASMNSVVASSGIHQYVSGVMSTHCCWNWVFGGDGNGTSYTPATFTLDGLIQNIYQWSLRQTKDTSLTVVGGNIPPAASAGATQNLYYPVYTSTTIDGSNSIDDDGSIVSYAWTKTSGPAGGTITSASSATTTITSLIPGTYVYHLVVTDNLGATGSSNVTINISGAPVVNAGVDRTITQPTSSTTLAGSASDEGSIAYSNISKYFVPGQGPISIAGIGSSSLEGFGSGPAPYTGSFWILACNEWKSRNLIDTGYNFGVISSNIYHGRPTGSPHVGSTNPSDPSYRPDPDATHNINAACAKPGVKLVIVAYNNSYDFMTAHEVMDCMREIKAYANALGIKVVFCSSSPRGGLSASEKANFKTVADSTKITFPGAPDFYYSMVTPGTMDKRPEFQYSGDVIHSNADGHIRLAQQLIASNPFQGISTSSSVITTPTSLTTTVTSLGLGTHWFMATSIDNDSLMSWDYMVVNVNPSSGVLANAGADVSINMPLTSVALNGSGSSGPISTYSWSVISRPSGAKAQECVITNANTATPTLSDVGVGSYGVRLTVSDGLGNTNTDDVVITGYPQKSRLPSSAAPVTYAVTINAAPDVFHTNVTSSISGSIKGGDTLRITAAPGTQVGSVTLYGSGPDGGWGGDSVRPVVITASPGIFIKTLRCNGQYIKITGINFQGSTADVINLPAKHSNVEVANCHSVGGENFILAKCLVDSTDVLTYGDNWVFKNDYFHDNYSINTIGEAYYIGHTFFFDGSQPATGYRPIKLDNCIMIRDTVFNAGWDGIQISNATNVVMSHLYVSGAGTALVPSQAYGIIFGGYCTGRVDSNYIKNSLSAGIAIFGYDTVKVRGNTTDSCGYADVQTNGTMSGALPFTSIFINDNNVPWIGTPSPTLVAVVQNNCIDHVSSYTGGAGIRSNNNNGSSRAGIITGNTIHDFLGRTLSNLIISNTAGETISGNILGTCASGNLTPSANAGADQTVAYPGTSTTLVGSGFDIDGTISTYAWTRISGPNTPTFGTSTAATTTVTGMTSGIYVFRLTVTDNSGGIGFDEITVRVNGGYVPVFKKYIKIRVKK